MVLDTTDLQDMFEIMENKHNQEPEDSYDYMVEMKEYKKRIKENLPEILQTKAQYAMNWIVFKVYYMLYAKPNMEMHMNRVRPMIETWLANTTYEQLVEAKIITEQDIIDNYKLLR